MTNEQYEEYCEKWKELTEFRRALTEGFITSCVIESQGKPWSWDDISNYIDDYFAPPSKEDLEATEFMLEDLDNTLEV